MENRALCISKFISYVGRGKSNKKIDIKQEVIQYIKSIFNTLDTNTFKYDIWILKSCLIERTNCNIEIRIYIYI